jgi:L-threonylcarbamoyladenylate synthase
LRAQILSPIPENIQVLAKAIRRGEVIGFPTETVYGLAGDALNLNALVRIFEVKERPTFDPLIVHIAPPEKNNFFRIETLEILEIANIRELNTETVQSLQRIIEAFWPGPLTLVLPKHSRIPDLATSGLPTVAVRMPAHPWAIQMIRASERPLAAPSANRFGRISPTTASAVAEEIGDRIDWILDGGPCGVGVESTILGLDKFASLNDKPSFQILRAGGTPKEKIEAVLGFSISQKVSNSSPCRPEAPGMLESHYAPKKPFFLLDRPLTSRPLGEARTSILELIKNQDITLGVLLFAGDPTFWEPQLSRHLRLPLVVRSLSKNGDLREVAQSLFSEMRALDGSAADLLVAEPCPTLKGLGAAISDRLRRATATIVSG